ncbi:nitronate monooxygenase [Nocardioides sp. SOB44]|uniref:Nitronate monooxygenase n=1 Tax=Nocardioides cremeus TaxID=3058044 RepID=A0ABT8TX36_9ACTN|nr:nitronate monooxygenase [Nocardioides cremeus]MDO3397533.1 nitronate monooxygenase [Nocardioides cremeus]
MTVLAGLRLASPVVVAAGCGGTGRELAAYGSLDALGAFTTRTITLDARRGGPVPRLLETPSGLLHATGLPNPGVDGFLATELPWLLQQRARVVVSVAARSLGELAELARRLGTAPGVSAIEVNVSPPDTGPEPELMSAREPFQVGAAVAAVERELPRGVPVLAKLRPDAVRVVEAARAAVEAGAQALVVGQALPASMPDGRAAGLSGPAVGPLALRCLVEVLEAVDVPVVAGGGVATVADVRARLALGAVAVQVGAALLHDPTTAARLVAALDPDTTSEETPDR